MSSLLNLLSKESVNVAALEQIYLSCSKSPTFVSDLVSALRQLDPDQASRASWLLCRYARDREFDEVTLQRIAASAEETTTHWITRLNLCRLFSITGCPESIRETIYPFLAGCFQDKRVIIRAWAISALTRFSDDIEYRAQIKKMILEARRDPGKAMQARLRQLHRLQGGG